MNWQQTGQNFPPDVGAEVNTMQLLEFDMCLSTEWIFQQSVPHLGCLLTTLKGEPFYSEYRMHTMEI